MQHLCRLPSGDDQSTPTNVAQFRQRNSAHSPDFTPRRGKFHTHTHLLPRRSTRYSLRFPSQVRSFFKGLSYPLWTTGILNSLYFGFYGNSLRMIEDVRGKPHYRNCCQDGPPYRGWHWDCFWAGCIGGTASTLINTPIELVKTILQADSSSTWWCEEDTAAIGLFNVSGHFYPYRFEEETE